MKQPSENELGICNCYMVIGKGYAYWNPETKDLYEFDKQGNLIKNSVSEKDPANSTIGNFYLRSNTFTDGGFSVPARDILDSKNKLYQNKKSMKSIEKMELEELKLNYPEFYQTAYDAGVKQEYNRTMGWINSGLTNKWEIRDGILSGKHFGESKKEEINNFYNQVDERLDGNFKNDIGSTIKEKVKAKENFYSQMEANEFYAEVDRVRS